MPVTINKGNYACERELNSNTIRKKFSVTSFSYSSLVTLKWVNPIFVLGNSLIPPFFEDFKFPCRLPSYLLKSCYQI